MPSQTLFWKMLKWNVPRLYFASNNTSAVIWPSPSPVLTLIPMWMSVCLSGYVCMYVRHWDLCECQRVCQGMSVCMYDTETCVNVSVFVRVCLYVCMTLIPVWMSACLSGYVCMYVWHWYLCECQRVCQGMSVCMYDTDTCVNVNVFVRVCLYVWMHWYLCECQRVCLGMSVCMYDTYTCVNVSVFVRVCLYVCMYVWHWYLCECQRVCQGISVCMYALICMYALLRVGPGGCGAWWCSGLGIGLMIHGSWVRVPPLADEHSSPASHHPHQSTQLWMGTWRKLGWCKSRLLFTQQQWSRWDFGCPHHLLWEGSWSSCEFLARSPGVCLHSS